MRCKSTAAGTENQMTTLFPGEMQRSERTRRQHAGCADQRAVYIEKERAGACRRFYAAPTGHGRAGGPAGSSGRTVTEIGARLSFPAYRTLGVDRPEPASAAQPDLRSLPYDLVRLRSCRGGGPADGNLP